MKIKGILPILVAFIVFFLVLEILFWKGQMVEKQQTYKYPHGTLSVTQIDVQAFAKILLYDLVFANENNEIFNRIRQLKTSRSDDFDFKNLNWKSLSLIEKLEISHADSVFTCYRYVSEQPYKQQVVYSSPFSRLDVGTYTYLVLSDKFLFTRTLIHQLQSNANSLILDGTSAPFSGFNLDANGQVSMTWDLQLAANKWTYRTRRKEENGYSLQPLQSGFHITASISGKIIDDLNNKFRLANLQKLSELDFISLNYESLDFLEDDDNSVLPRFQCLVHFKNHASLNSFYGSLVSWQQSMNGSDALKNGMSVQLIDTHRLLIYTTKEVPLIQKEVTTPVVYGNISALLNLTGGGWKKGMLTNFPLFQKLLSLTKQVEISSFSENNHQVILVKSTGRETIISLIFGSFL